MSKYSISNEHCEFWTGECWGVKEAREQYDSEEIPDSIPKDNYHFEKKILLLAPPFCEPSDWIYYDKDTDETKALINKEKGE